MKLEDIRFEKPHDGYAPREDSWLLAKAVQECAQEIRGKKCVDMGCGSGIQTAALLLAGAKSIVSVDVNRYATITTQKMANEYFPGADVKYVESSLFKYVDGTFDIIVFNPPYVPSEEIKWVETDGGKDGREIIDAFIETFAEHLTPGGMVLLLQSTLNGVSKTNRKLSKKGFYTTIIAREKLDFEELLVLKITKDYGGLPSK